MSDIPTSLSSVVESRVAIIEHKDFDVSRIWLQSLVVDMPARGAHKPQGRKVCSPRTVVHDHQALDQPSEGQLRVACTIVSNQMLIDDTFLGFLDRGIEVFPVKQQKAIQRHSEGDSQKEDLKTYGHAPTVDMTHETLIAAARSLVLDASWTSRPDKCGVLYAEKA
ncbi:hypothetical protein KCU85_g416, partial [Aureobasidium melanogenum]